MGHHHTPGHSRHDHDPHHDLHHDLPAALAGTVADQDLSPGDLSRRELLRGAGILGAGAAAGGVFTERPASAAARPATGRRPGERREPSGGYLWLAGDHHIHTQYSNDGVYRVSDHVRHASAYGLDWMVITDHGGPEHARIGVERVNPDIRTARAEFDDLLVFQGLEWNIPAAEHGTVFVHPGPDEVSVLKEFENTFDGVVTATTASTATNEALAISGVNFLADAVNRKRVADALFLANHPARKGLDSPHEIRAWRDAQPRVAVGMEGAPGHQAAGIPGPNGPGSARGYYENSATAASFPNYPSESYRTWGGFDWMTATVGGLWDSLLSEGKPWWITANSDSHWVYADTAARAPGSDFPGAGQFADPVYGGPVTLSNGDFWPGYYSRTHVGARGFSYAAVMDGLRSGRVWVDHGGLLDGLQVEARTTGTGTGVTLGGTLTPRPGAAAELVITIDLARSANWAQFVPRLARIDVIAGTVTGPVTDRDTFTAPGTRVVKSFEVDRNTHGQVTFRYPIGPVTGPRYFRLRGTDGNRSQVGFRGADVDPAGPAMDVVGNGDPWRDLWFYSNPIWVIPVLPHG